jgi:hypothetical protein
MYLPGKKKRKKSKLHLARTTLAGIAAAGVWAAGEPFAARALDTGYTDVRLLGRLATGGERWRETGWAIHLGNGALFGLGFGYVGAHGWKQGLLAAEIEHVALWPVMAIMDEVHPDRKDGTWPPLLKNPRVFAQETMMHGVFGATVGLLAGSPEPPTWRKRIARLGVLATLVRRMARRRAEAGLHEVAERLPEWDTVEKQLRDWEERGRSLADWKDVEKQLRDWEERGRSLADWDELADRLAKWEEAARKPIRARI